MPTGTRTANPAASLNANLDLVFDLPEDAAPIWVQADAGLMRQMLTNLMKNAIENMQENPNRSAEGGRKICV